MAKHQCVGGCGLECPQRPSRTVPVVVGSRTVAARAYGLSGRWASVTVLPASNRGRNARGTSASKRGWGGSAPKSAKRPQKRQDNARMGNSPGLRVSAVPFYTTRSVEQPQRTVADVLGLVL